MNAQGGGRPHFFKQDGRWYFGQEEGESFGPFDRIYEIVMSACVVGTWECESREISGQDMTQMLASN